MEFQSDLKFTNKAVRTSQLPKLPFIALPKRPTSLDAERFSQTLLVCGR